MSESPRLEILKLTEEKDALHIKVNDLEKEVYDLKVALLNAETALEIAKEQLEDALNEVSTYKYY